MAMGFERLLLGGEFINRIQSCRIGVTPVLVLAAAGEGAILAGQRGPRRHS